MSTQELDTRDVADRLPQRIGDGAWRIPYGSGHDHELYVLLVLEHLIRIKQYELTQANLLAAQPNAVPSP